MRHHLPLALTAGLLAVAGTLGIQQATSSADDDGPAILRDPKTPIAWVKGSEPDVRLGLLTVRRSGPKVVTAKLRLAVGRRAYVNLINDLHTLEFGNDILDEDVSGMRLLDEVHGTERGPLRDGDTCICSPTHSVPLGSTTDLYAKFPAPPRGVTRVSVHLPGFPSFDGVRISG